MTYKSVALTLLSGLSFLLPAQAQNETDALRNALFSQGATARSIGLGGAGGSYGGDFSSLSINPAGIGVYRNSKLMITPTLRLNNVKTNYLNTPSKEHNSQVNLNNIGAVFTYAAKGKEYEQSDWKTFSLAIGYNRLADFNSSITYSGSNSQSSFTDIMSQDAINSGIDENVVPPLGFFGYQGFLLYDVELTSIPHHTILDNGGSLLQTKSMESSGGIGDWTLSFGGNYKEKLMLGMSLDLISYKYDRDSYFSEDDETGDNDNDFAYFDYHESLSTTGLGFNLKFGAIYVINDFFRVGAAFHTPTWSSFSDASDYDLTSNTENLKSNSGQANSDPVTFVQPSQPYAFDYNLRTPWQAVLSATAFFGQHGFITADYSYVDYTSMKYRFNSSYSNFEHSVNNAIKDTYQGVHNLHIGVEGRAKNFMGRLGFAYHSSPYQRSSDFDGQSMDFTAGVGARFSAFSIDLGYRHTIRKSAEYAYPFLATGVVAGLAKMQQNNNLIALTLGYQF